MVRYPEMLRFGSVWFAISQFTKPYYICWYKFYYLGDVYGDGWPFVEGALLSVQNDKYT